jgi:hypothetical protein
VDTKYSLSTEGSNLSGIPEEALEQTQLVIEMLKKVSQHDEAKIQQSLKQKTRYDAMTRY